MGNSKGRKVYEHSLPEDFRRPQTDSAVEAFVRQKYEKKKFLLPGWEPTKPPEIPVSDLKQSPVYLPFSYKVGWNEGDEAVVAAAKSKTEVAKKVVMPPARSPTAPPTSRFEHLCILLLLLMIPRPAVAKAEPPRPVTAPAIPSSASSDLLGLLTSPTPVPANPAIPSSASSDLLGLQAEFGDFTSASPAPAPVQAPAPTSNSADLFGAMAQPPPPDSSKMSTSSIMALFGPASSPAPAPMFQPQQQQPMFQQPPQQPMFPGGGFPATPQQQTAAVANNPFLADALGGLSLGGQQQQMGGLQGLSLAPPVGGQQNQLGQLGGLSLGGQQGQASLWQ